MKLTKHPWGRRRVRITQLILFAVCAVVSTGYACQFWAITTNGSVADFTPYNVCADSVARLSRLYSPISDDGWGMTYYFEPNNPGCIPYRSDSTIYNGTQSRQDYINHYTNAATSDAWGVMVHARAGSPLIPDPHPFVYSLMGDDWSFQHNGTINHPDSVENHIGTGFCALDIFHSRDFTAWQPWNTLSSKKRIDSEYYGMQLMKDYLIALNYYTTAPVTMTPMEWALNAAEDHIGAVSSSTSLNAAWTNGQDIWQVRRSDASHTVSFWPCSTSTDGVRMISTRVRTDQPNGMIWHEMSQGKYVKLNPYEDIVHGTTHSFQKSLQTMPDTCITPRELRINGADNATGSQISPAISVDPVHSTFVAVWEDASTGRIKARWYNQMGLAEASEFFVDLGTANHTRSAPAIAHHPNGDLITIVWLDKPSAWSYYNKVMYRSYTWSQGNHAWQPIGTTESQLNVATTAGLGFRHPAISYSPHDLSENGTWGATWDGNDYKIYVHLSSWAANQELTYTPGASTYYSNPDICYWGCVDKYCTDERFKIIFVESALYVSPTARSIRTGSAKITNYSYSSVSSARAMGSTTTSEYPSPSICYSGTLSSMTAGCKQVFYSVTNSQLRITSELHDYLRNIDQYIADVNIPSSSGAASRTDIARRTDGFDICFSKTNGTNGLDVYDALHTGTTVGNPVLVNTTAGNSDQKNPCLAISQSYECRDGDTLDFYTRHDSIQAPGVPPFAQRRVILWQSNGQSGGTTSDDVVGRFAGVYGVATNDRDWYYYDPTNFDIDPANAKDDLDDLAEDESGTQPGDGYAHETPAGTVPTVFAIQSAYPNPFNPTTTIRFDVPASCDVQIKIYDIQGRLAATLLNGYVSAGYHHLVFDGGNFSSGIYFVQMKAQNFSGVQKIQLIK
jgi:predicted glutamine amidotransferase